MKLRFNPLCLWLLVFLAGQEPLARAQTPPSPTPEQLMQLMGSQPPVDISAPVTATASFDPPAVRPGEKAVYRVSFNATAVSVNWPDKILAPPELNIHLNASGQSLQVAGGEFQNIAMFDFDVRADATGQFTVPEFTVQVYGQPVSVPAARLDVATELTEPHEPARQLLIEPAATNVFVGESFNVRVLLPATAAGEIQGVSDVQLNGDSFVVDKNAMRQSVQPILSDGRQVNAYIYETSITPIAAGTLKLSAQGFTPVMRSARPPGISGQAIVPGGSPQINLLDSEPVAIQVRPLPSGEELPGFNGLVGSYICDPPSLVTNCLEVGEPARLTIVIRSQKNPCRIDPPPPPRAGGWQIFPAVRSGLVGGPHGAGARFQYTLIPLTNAVRATPAIPFSCFDPASGQFVDLTIPSLPVTVLAGDGTTNLDTSLLISEDSAGLEQKPGLGRLATAPGRSEGSLVPLQLRGWFPLVQIFPALGFGGLWWWDQRRRFLEQHPEIVRRRLARRALRRERRQLEQAAVRGDAEKFVHHAISALQIVCAPHFPATPRALVGGDVLQILTATEREGKPGETVRHFFASADAAGFSNVAGGQTALLAEKTSLIETIFLLEARL